MDAAALKNALLHLREAVVAVNISEIRPTMKGLQRFAAYPNAGGAVDTVLRAAMGGEYDKTAALIDELLKSL